MPTPVAYTDLFNQSLDALSATLSAVTGLQVVTDPRNISPPCVFIDAPSFTGFSRAVFTLSYPVRLLTLGPGNLDAQRSLMNLAAKVVSAQIGVTDGRPSVAIIGGSELPAYDLNINVQAQS
jgi:hypothetical protein